MKKTTRLFTIIAFLTAGTLLAQENVFLDRDFWKGNPDLSVIKTKIEAGNDATVFNENGFDAVVYALLENADSEVINYLLTIDGNTVDKRTHDSRIYLHWAAYAGNTKIMETLLEKGSSLTAKGSHGNTPLTFAAVTGQMDTAVYDLFEKNGVNLAEDKNENGANALLLIAPYAKDYGIIDYFTGKGLSLNSKDDDGNGLFQYAAQGGQLTVLKKLKANGAPYKSIGNGGNAIIFASQGTHGHQNSLKTYQYLESLGIKASTLNANGRNPLHTIAYNSQDRAVFNHFIDKGIKVDHQDDDGNSPFMNAANSNTLKVVKFLLPYVKNVNAQNKEGRSALTMAVNRNSPEIVDFLLQNGADISIKDKDENTLAYYLLNTYNIDKTEVFEAKLKLLQNKGLSMTEIQHDKNTLYHLAAEENDLNLIKRLESFEIDVNAKNSEGLTALHLAAMKAKDDQMMKYLISQGANPKIKTDFEESAYDLASENELLQKQNVELNFLD